MKKYLIDNEEVSEEEFNEQLEDCVYAYVEDNYDDILDECYNEIEIGNLRYSPSQVLKKCDPIAYNCGISDEQSFQLDEAKDELERGSAVSYNNTTFEIIEEDEDE